MSVLLSLLKNDPAALYKKEIAQLVAMCGDGKLTDGSECCAELREYLHIAESELCLRMPTPVWRKSSKKAEVSFRMS